MFLPIFPFKLLLVVIHSQFMISALAAVQLFVLVAFGVRVPIPMEMLICLLLP